MPRTKSKPRKRKSRKQKSSGLTAYLIAGAFCAAMIWLIAYKPQPSAPLPATQSVAQTAAEKPSKAEAKARRKAEKKQAEAEKKQAAAEKKKLSKAKPVAAKPKAKPKAQIKPQLPSPERVFALAMEKLGVPAASVKTKKTDAKTTYSVPIDRNRMDLTFANMIVKGQMERSGSVFAKGTDKGGRQTLEFRKGARRYLIDLYYDKAPYSATGEKKYIAIVVDDFGATDGALLQGFLDLPTAVTFAIFPDLANSVRTMELARAQKRESLIHVPMEPLGYPRVNPGKDPILVQMGASEVARIIGGHLNKMPACIGINNHMGSLATTQATVMGHVMKPLKAKGKIFLDSRTSNVSVAYQVAQKALVPAYRNDLFLDSPDISDATLERKIAQIKSLAAGRKNIIAITHCHSQAKLDYLKQFIRRIEAEGFTLVPLSQLSKYDVPDII